MLVDLPEDDDDITAMGTSEMSFGEAARRRTSVDRRMMVAEALQNSKESDDEEGDDDALRRWEDQRIWTGVTLPTGQVSFQSYCSLFD